MNDFFKRFVVMTFLCSVEALCAQHGDMTVRQSTNINVVNTKEVLHLDLNIFGLAKEHLLRTPLTCQSFQNNIPVNETSYMKHLQMFIKSANVITSLDSIITYKLKEI